MPQMSVPIEMYVGGAELAVTAEIEFRYSPGYPGSQPSFSSPGDPPEPAEVDVGKVTLVIVDKTGREPVTLTEPAPQWLVNFIANSDELYRQMCDEGEEASQPDPDAAYDAFRDALDERSTMHCWDG